MERGVLREAWEELSLLNILGTEKGLQALAKFPEALGAFTKTGQPCGETALALDDEDEDGDDEVEVDVPEDGHDEEES
ncbi:hypothetical protein MVEN_00711300 [Mycena venus]|uniref:Uncharacterized protein n=1 Tax=Mycena venus TaxID=2733690 RepID=A0A8H7D2N3_9AGAR|nr:hypothetical protein MVEN_00711300 [Mycena venus]